MPYHSFEELEIWKRGCRMAVDLCRELASCPNFSLRDQMQRAAISIPSNIAEGAERDSVADFAKFLRYAKGSAGELRTQAYIAIRLDLMDRAKGEAFVQELRELGAMIQGLIFALTKSEN
ncbi:MAG: four helix bundle protein [Verrucomicrobia bacterium 61-8]|nr:four helix bundle protein [Verrucomicrobiota bacterium]OJU99541.1 MAG: four helix bundle protein [Verrucomicrobia bacterium 61-8]